MEFEEEPAFDEPWLRSPPTPPSPFEYQSPHLSPLGDSPPLREFLEAHEFTENFFDPNRPHMRKSVTIGGGMRVPLRRHSRAPPLSPITNEHLEGLFPSPPPGDAFQRALERARQHAPPTPPTPPQEPEVCKKGKGAKRKTSKTKLKKGPQPSTSKTKAKEVEQSTSKSKPKQTPEKSEMGQLVYRPLTRKEHYFAESFSDPKHKELMARVTQLIADVGSPLIESPPQERDRFDDIEGTDTLDSSSPQYNIPADEDLPELSPRMPIPQFGFQPDFFTPPKPYKLPIKPLSPSDMPR